MSGRCGMVKKWLAFLLAAVMAFGAGAAFSEGGAPAAKTRHEIAERTMNVYVSVIEASFDMPFYFMDGVADLPWVDLDAASGLICGLANIVLNDKVFELSYEVNGETITLTRENGFPMIFDFASDTIHCPDFNMFLHNSTDSSVLDMLSTSGYNSAGEPELFHRNPETTIDRLGNYIEICLSDYSIEMVFQDGRGYIPLQTLGDLILTPGFGVNTFYNGKAVFLADRYSFGSDEEGYTPLGVYYYSAEPCERSEELARFGYNELCLALDCLYGLKESHEISYFDTLFWQLGYGDSLKDTDASVADDTLSAFLSCCLDDLHSGFTGCSWMNGKREAVGLTGTAAAKNAQHQLEYAEARSRLLGDVPFYTEVGNTAYITLDGFLTIAEGDQYYNVPENGTLPEDTVGGIITAHRNICREGSPIENVVIDLSCNGGGFVDAALFLTGWVLGETPFSMKNTFTGALSTAGYRSDVNLDRRFDERDVLTDKKVFCLISPLSFSCGNLVPAIFKDSQRVTLLGRTSGGGSCMVMSMSTAWGTMFQISGHNRMSFAKNGSFYDIDQGVEPDIYLTNIDSFYDREKLTAYINSLI